MTDSSFYRGLLYKEDFDFGTGNGTRIEDGVGRSLTQFNKSQIPRKVNIKTSDFIIDKNSWEGEVVFTNEGASKTITFSLPSALQGLGPYIFIVTEDGQQINIDPNGSEYFRDCAAGKYKYSSDEGNILKVWCDIDGIWEYSYQLVTGFWDDES